VPRLGQLPIQTISSGAGFIADVQTSVALLKTADQTTNRCRICVDLSDESDLALPAIFGYRHSVAHRGNAQANETSLSCFTARPPALEHRLALAASPRSLAQCGTGHLNRGWTCDLTAMQSAVVDKHDYDL
jgi:hypothetical protein